MPGRFIDVQVDAAAAQDPALAKKLSEVCAVDIFGLNADGSLKIVEANLDECVLCDLCLQAAPGKVRVLKLYE
jgi:NAD-dependent dihydropyrimidine dehydrogenase PreA subunit